MAVKATATVTVFNVSDGTDGRMLYATCQTAPLTAAKVATVSSGTVSLYTGLTVAVQFMHTNTAASPTLNVNGTGAKPIWVNGAAVTAADCPWVNGATRVFTYDGFRWVMAGASGGGVGGTNLLLGTADGFTGDLANGSGTKVAVDLYGGINGWTSSAAWSGRYLNMRTALARAGVKVGDWLTISVWFKPTQEWIDSGSALYLFRWDTDGGIWLASASQLKADVWQRFSVTRQATEYMLSASATRFESTVAREHFWCAPKLELGTVPTDWSPSPGDVQNGIDTAQNAADKAQADIDGMEVGGTNIYLGDIADRVISSNNSNTYPISSSRMADGPMGMAYRHIVRSGAGANNTAFSIYNSPALSVLSEPLAPGQTYTASCLVRTNCTCANNAGVTIGYLYSPTLELLDKVYGPAIQGTGEWERWWMTFTVPEQSGQTGFRILPYVFTFGPGVTWETAYVDLARYKIERGTTATDWSPAPGDVQAGIDDAQGTANAGIKEQVTLFYAAASATAPSKPTANVTTSSATTYAAWNRTLPTYRAANPYLYVCTQSLTNGGTYSWSTVESGNYADWAAALGTRLTTAETKISQNTADIALKASQTEVSSLGTRVSTAEANIDANRAAIALKVSQAQFDAMKVGGTNLCPGSNIAGTGGWTSNGGASVTVSNVDLLGQKCVHAVMTSNTTGRIPSLTMAYTDWMTLELGTEYTLSAEIMLPDGGNSVPNSGAPLHYHCFFSDTENPTTSLASGTYAGAFKSVRIVEGNTAWVAGEWKRITIRYVTKDAPVDDEHPYIKYRQYIYGGDSANPTELYLRNYKFEKGNVPTAWSPAPEDMATSAELEITADSITQRVDGLAGDVATVTTTANEFSVQLQSAIADLTGDIDTNAENIATVTAMVRVTSDNGRPVLGLGSSGSTLAVQLTNDQLSFLDSGQAVAYINGQRLYITTAEVTGMLRLGNFALVPQSDGSLALKLVG